MCAKRLEREFSANTICPIFLSKDDHNLKELLTHLQEAASAQEQEKNPLPSRCYMCDLVFEQLDAFAIFKHQKACKAKKRREEEKRLRGCYNVPLSVCILMRPHIGVRQQHVSTLIHQRYFISDEVTARDEDFFGEKEIRGVVNCAKELEPLEYSVEAMYIRLNDTQEQKLELDRVFEFVKSFDVNEKILFHCRMGQSRAPAVLMAVLIKVESLSLFDSLRLVKASRESAYPNKNFLNQLLMLEKEVHTRNSITEEALLLHEESF